MRSHVHQVLGELAKQIPERNYRVLYMHWIEGRPMPEIARVLNLSIEQVWTRHHRANTSSDIFSSSITIERLCEP